MCWCLRKLHFWVNSQIDASPEWLTISFPYWCRSNRKSNSSFKLYCKSLLACWMAVSCSRWLSRRAPNTTWLINANFKCFLWGREKVDAILIACDAEEIYGEWLTQANLAYLPSDKNTRPHKHIQDKSVYSLIHYSLGPLVQRKLFILPSDGYTESW